MNGYEGDRSAAEYRLRDGDVAWWDYRSWEREGEARVVVGAFPEPFLHGFDGKTPAGAVRYAPGPAGAGTRAGPEIGADSVEPLGTAGAGGSNVLEVRRAAARCGGAPGRDGRRPVRFVLTARRASRRVGTP